MTVMDASAATGINPKVIYSHIHRGTLDATCGLNGRYDISPRELHLWHVWMWRTSNAIMFPPWRSEKFVRDFGLCERQKPTESADNIR